MMRGSPRRADWWFLGELLAALVLLGLLGALAYCSDAQASGITNMLLGAGGGYRYLSTTVTVGEFISDDDGYVGYCASSELCGDEIGSISTSSIPGGYTIESIEEIILSSEINGVHVIVSGFSASPGASWLGAVTFNSHTFVGSAATYSYSSGTATWTWTTSTGWAWTDGDEYAGMVGYR